MVPVDSDTSSEVTVIGHRVSTPFHKRYLKFEFIMGLDKNKNQKTFSDGNIRLVLEYFRATVSINYQGGSSLPECECTIYNLDEIWTKQLSTLGQYQRQTNTYMTYLKIYASMDHYNESEEKPVYDKIFEGGITVAYTDYSSTSDLVFHVNAMAAAGLNLFPAKSVAFKGKVPVDHVMQSIINNYNTLLSHQEGVGKLNFRNYGVNAFLNNPNYHGDMIDQIRSCTHDVKSRFSFKDQICYIFPEDNSVNAYEGQQRQKKVGNRTVYVSVQGDPHQISVGYGMIGYPTYADNGITVRCIFNRSIRFGEEIFVQSDFQPACGLWKYMISLNHQLSCFLPNGSWYTSIGLSKIAPKEIKREGNRK